MCIVLLALSSAGCGGGAVTVVAQALPSTASRFPRTDNLVALEMGGRVENRMRDLGRERSADKALDGDPSTYWMAPTITPELVLSFLGHDSALVSSVTLTFPPRFPDPIWGEATDAMWPKDVEISTSMDGPTVGFRRVAVATLPREPGDRTVTFSAPVEARYVKLAITSNYGSPRSTLVAEVQVREGQMPGYVPFLKRHSDLASLFVAGGLPATDANRAVAPAVLPAANAADVCAPPTRPDVRSSRAESRSVLVVSPDGGEWYAPYFYSIYEPESPAVRYFAAGPGDGRVDSSIFRRAAYWPVPPEAARPAALVPSSGVDTVVLEQVCDARTRLSSAFKRALIDWVADGHKLIIQDSDKCGPTAVPDYSFLPFQFATNNPGPQGAPSRIGIVENNFLVSPDPSDPAFFDEENWRLTKNGNATNDFGDSNTIGKFDPHWCGMLAGTNVTGGHGFVGAYAHHGRGVILYDGVDRDQRANVAYRNYVARQLLLPFDPDGLPCSTRLAPFVVTTEPSLVRRSVLPSETYSYPLSLLAVEPGYKGSVRLSLSTSPDVTGLVSRIQPDTVSLGNDAKSTLTLTMPQKLPESWRMAVRGVAADANATLCLAASERRTGTLTVTSELGSRAPTPSSKNLLIVLDLSGSMNLPLGNSTRIATARRVLREALERIPDDFTVGLRLYGHRFGSRQKETCTDSELVVPMRRLDRDLISKTVGRFRPRGETPLVYSALQAANDLKSVGGGSVVLITDGEESCNGDFAAATRALAQSGIDLRLSIVGFTLTDASARQPLAAIATATGGRYYTAADGPALTRALVAATISRFPYSVISASGVTVAKGEAGDKPQELPPGDYKVVVQAGDEELVIERMPVAVARNVTVRVVRKGDRFTLER